MCGLCFLELSFYQHLQFKPLSNTEQEPETSRSPRDMLKASCLYAQGDGSALPLCQALPKLGSALLLCSPLLLTPLQRAEIAERAAARPAVVLKALSPRGRTPASSSQEKSKSHQMVVPRFPDKQMGLHGPSYGAGCSQMPALPMLAPGKMLKSPGAAGNGRQLLSQRLGRC